MLGAKPPRSANVEAVRLAYKYDSDVNIATNDGSTLIHASVTGTGNSPEVQAHIVEVIQFLADHGARLDDLNKANSTAIDIADVGPTDRAVLLITKLILAKAVAKLRALDAYQVKMKRRERVGGRCRGDHTIAGGLEDSSRG